MLLDSDTSVMNDEDEKHLLFDAHSLHGAAVSMCAPRVIAVLSDIIVTIKGSRGVGMNASIDELQAAVKEFGMFTQALESGDPPSHAMVRPTTSSGKKCNI